MSSSIEIDVLFLKEHDDREDQALEELCKLLSTKYQMSCVIISITFHAYLFDLYKPKLVVLPYLINKNDWPIAYFIKKFGTDIQYLSLNWEQLLSKSNMIYKTPKDSFVKKQAYHVAWSENFKQFLVDAGTLEENITVTGNIGVTLLQNYCNTYIGTIKKTLSKQYGLDEEKEWIFLPMNYGWAFSSDNIIQAKIKKGYPEKIAWEYKKYSYDCLNEFISFVLELNKDNSVEIIIRPHPSISIENYTRLLKKSRKGILVTKDYTIREWIAASNVVGSSWSTSVWDAYNIGKKCFLFTPIPRPEWLDVWWNNEINNLSSASELSYSINKHAEKTSNNFENVAKVILKLLSSNNLSAKKKIKVRTSQLKIYLYKIRSYLRSISAKYLNGFLVPKGLLRDHGDVKSFFPSNEHKYSKCKRFYNSEKC